MVKKLPLQNGEYALVDDEDYGKVSGYNWIYHKNGKNTLNIHARKTNLTRKSSKTIKLSRLIMGLESSDKRIVWHQNRNYLDCRKKNLIVISRSEMSYLLQDSKRSTSNLKLSDTVTRRKSKSSLSKFKGVTKDHCDYFIAKIYKDQKEMYIGYYKNEAEAAKAYDKKAYELYGDKAILNFPEDYSKERSL